MEMPQDVYADQIEKWREQVTREMCENQNGDGG
jgi:hypothetical protein